MNRSLLKHDLLLALQEHPSNNLTVLAEQVGYLRPAVSRAISQLRREGYLHKDGRLWHLTEQGASEAMRIQNRQNMYDSEIGPLMEQVATLAEHYHIPFVAVFTPDEYIMRTFSYLPDDTISELHEAGYAIGVYQYD